MDPIRRSLRRFGPIFVVIAVQSALLSGANVAPSQSAPVPEKPFANVVEPIGVAATTAFGYATRPLCTSEANPTRQVVSFDSTGSVKVVATLPTGVGCRELYIAVAPGPADNTVVKGYPTPNPAGFTSNELYVTDGATIFVIRLKKNPNGSVALNPDGSYQFQAPTTFATLSPCVTSGRGGTGITFDETTTGAFGNKLIVTCQDGNVWALKADGTTGGEGSFPFTSIATSSGPFEGPVVATEGPFAGTLLVAAENSSCGTEGPFRPVQAARFSAVVACPTNPGQVFQVTPGGAVSTLADVPSAEGVTIIPSNKCTLGLTAGFTYFTAIFKPAGAGGPGGTIDQLPRGAFADRGGNALVTSENGETQIGIAQVSSGGVVTEFRHFFHQHQGSAFADCLVPVLVKIRVIRHGTTITVRIFSSRNFFSGNLIPSTALFGPYTSPPPAGAAAAIRCKLATRGERGEGEEGDDEEENANRGISTCTFPNNLAPGQLGIIKFKFNDPAGPGDGDGEGGG